MKATDSANVYHQVDQDTFKLFCIGHQGKLT